LDLQDQLKKLFPDHTPNEEEIKENATENLLDIWIQEEPLRCKYEKRKGKVNTIIEGYNGANSDFKTLTKHLQKACGVGGSFKKESIIIQGDFRDKIMQILIELGFKVKRVGG
jgi:translation initiation factor 1